MRALRVGPSYALSDTLQHRAESKRSSPCLISLPPTRRFMTAEQMAAAAPPGVAVEWVGTVAELCAADAAVGERLPFRWHPLSIPIETPTKGRGY